MENELTHAELMRQLAYDPVTGIFTWRVRNSNRALIGSVAGCVDSDGYLVIRLNKRNYQACRLAYFYVHGAHPQGLITNRNGVKHDNAIDNLLSVTNSQIQMGVPRKTNNTSGFKGVKWNKKQQKWNARYKIDGRYVHLGTFITPELASAAYVAATKVVFGAFFKA